MVQAVNPIYVVDFFVARAAEGVPRRSARIFLVVTGGEALYADMGHFGRRPIALGLVRARAARRCCSTTSGRRRLLIGHPGDDRAARSSGWLPTWALAARW